MKKCSMILLGTCLAAIVLAQETQEEWAAAGKSRAAWFERIFDRMLPQTAYDKVVDQNGVPLAKAEVGVRWEDVSALSGKHSGLHNDSVRTDELGRWELTLNKPFGAYISDD